MKSSNRELVDRLAAEYVLGTLRGRARRRFERWLVSPQVRSIVNDWELRLSGLEPSPQKVAPPSRVWQGIEKRLELGRPRRSTLRWLAVAASVLVVALAGLFTLRTPPLAATARAAIEADPQTIYWNVELLGDSRNPTQEIAVQARSPHPLESGLMTSRGLLAYAAASGGVALVIGAYLVAARGPLALALLAAGAFFVLF